MSSDYDVHTALTPYAESGKVIYALCGEGVVDGLRDRQLRSALAEAGATHLQVNLDDAAVAGAMRISAGAPIKAILSVWAPAESAVVDRVSEVLTGMAERVAGWRVDERRPLAVAESWDGSRLDALANVALLRRPADLDEDTWRHRWLVDHTPVAIESQASFGYIQNLVVDAVIEDSPPTDAIVEELFPSAGVDDIHAFYGSDGDDEELAARLSRLMGSVGRFGADRDLDLVPSSRYLHLLST